MSLYYGIEDSSAVGVSHLLSLLFYTDFTDFSYWFSKSFRKKNRKESEKQFKERHSNYHFLAKHLREIVEIYGTKISTSKILGNGNKVLYFFTGLNQDSFTFPSFCSRLYGPTSTTAQITVATVFAKKNGMIVTLNQASFSGNLRFFNCSLLSAYKSEDERLFLGGRLLINFFNIRQVKGALNYMHFVKPIAKLDTLLNGNVCDTVEKKEGKLVVCLFDDYLQIRKNQFPLFVNKLFASIMENKYYSKIDLRWLEEYGKEFSSLLLSEEHSLFVRIDYLCKLCCNLKTLCLCYNEGRGAYKINEKYLSLLVSALSVCSLSEFKILNVEKDCSEKGWKVFIEKMKGLNFVVKIEKRKEGFKGKEIPCLIIKN